MSDVDQLFARPEPESVPAAPPAPEARPERLMSVDAVRGLVIFTMIFVNDLAGAPREIVPWWMRHFKANGNGMTFVDLVFPAFLFIVGLSLPAALSARQTRGESSLSLFGHVLARTLALLTIGILMVNETPDTAKLGWSGDLWSTLMYLAAILAFASFSKRSESAHGAHLWESLMRWAGLVGLIYLALTFRGSDGRQIISFAPFSIRTSWYGILGLIGWAYFVAAVVLLIFGASRTALLACVALLMCLYPADRHGAFDGFWLSHYVGIGGTLGSQAAITVAGALLGSILITSETSAPASRTRFALLYIAGFAAAAMLVYRVYGINKNAATPSWCLWACAITGALWLLMYWIGDVLRQGLLIKPFAVAGRNVLLAYLLSEMLPSALTIAHLGSWYDHLAAHGLASAIGRSAGCGVVLLLGTAGLNTLGFRVKL